MNNDVTSGQTVQSLPADVDERLSYWYGLWNRSASYHYFFGVISVGASVISTSLDGNPAKAFSIIAAIATALIGFMHPERRYAKFVRAWRVLDVAAMRYRHGLCDKAALIDAVERGEALISEFEDKVEAAPEKNAQAATDAPVQDRGVPPAIAEPQAPPQPPAGTLPTGPTPGEATTEATDPIPTRGAVR